MFIFFLKIKNKKVNLRPKKFNMIKKSNRKTIA